MLWLLHCYNYKITENLANLHKKIILIYTLTLYKYVDAKTILQIQQKEKKDDVLWKKN